MLRDPLAVADLLLQGLFIEERVPVQLPYALGSRFGGILARIVDKIDADERRSYPGDQGEQVDVLHGSDSTSMEPSPTPLESSAFRDDRTAQTVWRRRLRTMSGKTTLMPTAVVWVTSALLIIGAILTHFSHGFYNFLHVVVCAVFAWAVVIAILQRRALMACICGSLALLFNPIYPVRLSRDLWEFVDFVVALWFFAAGGSLTVYTRSTSLDKAR
jgi:hypothetical protein